MKSLVAVYDSHDATFNAASALIENRFPRKNISVISRAEDPDQTVHVKTSKNIEATELSVGAVAGPLVGILTGVGLFAIPGFGFLYGAGALVGALAGFDFGLIAGGVAAILTMIGVNIENHAIYQTHLQEGKYLLILQGPEEDLRKAETILEHQGGYVNMKLH